MCTLVVIGHGYGLIDETDVTLEETLRLLKGLALTKDAILKAKPWAKASRKSQSSPVFGVVKRVA